MSVLVVLAREEEVIPLINWGEVFASSKNEPLVLQVLGESSEIIDPVTIDLEAEQSSPLLEVVQRQAKLLDNPPRVEHWRAPHLNKAVLKASKEHKASLVLAGQAMDGNQESDALKTLGPSMLQELLCDVLMLRAELGSGLQCKKVLIPTAGGPHANGALKLLSQVAEQSEGEVTAMMVVEEDDTFGEDVGRRKLDRVFKEAGVEKSERINKVVLRANKPTDAIREEAKNGYDLIVLGTSQQGAIRKSLFGTIPERMLRGPSKTAIAIFRAAPPLLEKTGAQVSALLRRWVPQLDRQSRIELSDRLHQGSKAGLDFIALISFSTAIAAFGLLQNSVAVIIGAMLVAPLMTPMLGAGLGLVQGNIMLVRHAIRSIALGFVLSLLVGFLIGQVPNQALTAEMLGRGTPNLLDLGIALLSGAAAAYALARPGLLEALPGVAISAALVPPIATSGISLALGETRNAIGSALLFGTNLVAIILSTSVMLFVLGVRPRVDASRQRVWARRGWIGLLLAAFMLSFPLGTTLLSRVTLREQTLNQNLKKVLTQHNLSLESIRIQQQQGRRVVLLKLYSPTPLPSATAKKLIAVIQKHTGRKSKVRIITFLEYHSGT